MKAIQYTDYLKIKRELNMMKGLGIKIIPKHKNKVIKVIGFTCLGLAIIPNGLGVVLFPLSFMLLGITWADVNLYKRRTKNLIKYYKQKQRSY